VGVAEAAPLDGGVRDSVNREMAVVGILVTQFPQQAHHEAEE